MDVAELKRQVEYKFAPEPLLVVQALANTYSFEDAEERLGDPAASRRWLVDSGLAERSVVVAGDDHERLLALRTIVRGLLEANHETDAEPDYDALAELAAAHPAPLAVSADGDLGLDLRPVDTVDRFVAQVLGVIFEARALGTFERLKICACDECRWAFYDTSRNRGGIWCRMEECGNRIKNRRYRQRRAAGPA